jgi:hypothetical protein
MSPRRSRSRRDENLMKLQARVDRLGGQRACPKLLHLAIASRQPPSVTPGCEDCAKTYAAWEQMPRPPAPAQLTDVNRARASYYDDELVTDD